MPYQLYQARAAGADAVLLIAAILSDQDLYYLRKVAFSLGLSVLVEVHDSVEMERVLNIGSFPIIGINNRDLTSFKTDLAVTENLAKKFGGIVRDQGAVLVSESGFFSRSDLDRAYEASANAVLIGESLMRQPDVCAALRKLIGI